MLWQQCSSVSKLVIHSYHFCCKGKMWYPNKSPGLWDSWTPPVVFVSAALLILFFGTLLPFRALLIEVVVWSFLLGPSCAGLCQKLTVQLLTAAFQSSVFIVLSRTSAETCSWGRIEETLALQLRCSVVMRCWAEGDLMHLCYRETGRV